MMKVERIDFLHPKIASFVLTQTACGRIGSPLKISYKFQFCKQVEAINVLVIVSKEEYDAGLDSNISKAETTSEIMKKKSFERRKKFAASHRQKVSVAC